MGTLEGTITRGREIPMTDEDMITEDKARTDEKAGVDHHLND